MSISITRVLVLMACLLFGIGDVAAQALSISKAEIDARNEAAAFVMARQGSSAFVIGECASLLKVRVPKVETVIRDWHARNKNELEAAVVWSDRYLLSISKDVATHQRVSKEVAQILSQAVLGTSRSIFKRQLPTSESCEFVVKQYEVPALDIKNIGANPGYERFGKYAKILGDIHSEPDFAVLPHLNPGYERVSRFVSGWSNMPSLDAAEAAKERGDGLGRVAALQSMAQRGDGVAAQSIGIMYLNGDLVPKDPSMAYRWFYAAWTLSEYEGLNAMGVMLRDGLWVSPNLPLAQASFMLAAGAANNQSAHDRALVNATKLGGLLRSQNESTAQIACLNLRGFDEELHKPIQAYPQLVQGKEIVASNRKLGSMIKGLTPAFRAESCS